MPTVNVGLRVVTQVLLAMCGSVPINWACCRGMFVLDVEAARIANIPAVKFIDGGGSKVALGCCRGHCQWVWAIWRSDYSTGDKNCTRPFPCISEWTRATSTTTGTTPSAAPIAAPTLALTETPTVEWGRNVQCLDGGCINGCWHLRLLIAAIEQFELYTTAGFATCVSGALSCNDKFCMCNQIAI
jgi:hypothetical protein